MPGRKTPKHSETLEIRLSYEAKTAFMAHCRDSGRTASETLRGLIDDRIAAPARARVAGWPALAGACVAGLALGAAAGPTLAHTYGSANARHGGPAAADACRER